MRMKPNFAFYLSDDSLIGSPILFFFFFPRKDKDCLLPQSHMYTKGITAQRKEERNRIMKVGQC